MSHGVFVLAGVQSDFARNVTREGLTLAGLVREGVHALLERAPVPASEIQTVHVGNFAGELYTGQGHLGALVALAHPALRELPTVRHEAACASGSMAVLSAMAELEAGRYDVALVLGVELMRNRSGFEAQALLKAAALVPDETEGATYPWAEQFARIQAAYEEAYGVDTSAALRELARENFRRARLNPLAQTRSWTLDEGCFGSDEGKNPLVSGKLRKHDCSQISDGYAALLLVSGRWLARHALHFGVRADDLARIQGFGHRGSPIALAEKLREPCDANGFLGHVRRTVLDAFARAGTAVEAIDVAEVHDCFSISALLAIEALGLAAPGQAVRAVEARSVFEGGPCVLNPSGGLMGVGHPVGATGVRMVLDAARQVTGNAGAAQVPGARRAATLNIGGSTATVASFVLGRGA